MGRPHRGDVGRPVNSRHASTKASAGSAGRRTVFLWGEIVRPSDHHKEGGGAANKKLFMQIGARSGRRCGARAVTKYPSCSISPNTVMVNAFARRFCCATKHGCRTSSFTLTARLCIRTRSAGRGQCASSPPKMENMIGDEVIAPSDRPSAPILLQLRQANPPSSCFNRAAIGHTT